MAPTDIIAAKPALGDRSDSGERPSAPRDRPRAQHVAAHEERAAAPHFAHAAVALCTIDRQRRFEAVNLRMYKLIDAPVGSLLGRFAASVFADADTVLSSCFAKADTGARLADLEFSWRGRRLQICFSPIIEDGVVQALGIAATDISRRVRMEKCLHRSRQHLRSLARQDHLTGVLNRRGLDTHLRKELRRASLARTSIAVLLVDVDHFKRYNDCLGHLAGDRCLRNIADALTACGQGVAAVARYGGEEFALVVCSATPMAVAALADRCRQAINDLGLAHPARERKSVSVSIGVAYELPDSAKPIDAQIDELLMTADEALYRAKMLGRDRVSFDEDRARRRRTDR